MSIDSRQKCKYNRSFNLWGMENDHSRRISPSSFQTGCRCPDKITHPCAVREMRLLGAPIFKKAICNDCGSHRVVSLITIVAKLLALTMMRRLTPIRESNVREQWAGFRPGRGWIDETLTVCQTLEIQHAHRHSSGKVLRMKGASDSANRTVSFSAHHWNGISERFVTFL